VSIVVIGKNGQVARALARRAKAHGLALQCLGRDKFDLEAPNFDAIAALTPSIVINAAAYTAVDQAEREPERAFQINAVGAEAVAAAAERVGAACVQVSTDYVFSGDKSEPYVETDVTGPTGVYGASKLEGEQRVLAANPRAAIVRTAWVFDAQGKNFVRTMLRLARTRDEISVVADQRGSPTFADDLADALLCVARAQVRGEIYHCAGAGETTWAEFARAVFLEAETSRGPNARVLPIETSDYPTLAQRPTNSTLDCTKLALHHGVRMRPWRDALQQCIGEIAAGGWSVE
jgi:dTDP-4-dehydrorhamnose reductase